MVSNQAAALHTQSAVRRSTTAGAIGVFVHWFDWAVYAYLATTIAAVFFPAQDETAGLLSVFAVFAVAFAVRPLGSMVFGPMGDRIGRRKTLSVVILLMTGGTLVVGLLPGYNSIGVLAPALLVVARVTQGLAAGGEFGSAAAFLAEHSPRKRRGLGVSWLEVGGLLGFLAASAVVLLLNSTLSDAQVTAWAWRIPFLLAAPLGVIGFYIRLKVEDTPEFRALEQADAVPQTPMRELFATNKTQLLQMAGVEIMQHVTFYVVLVYLLTYQIEELGTSSADAALAATVTSLIAVMLIPVFGALSDRVGRRPLLMMCGAGLILTSYPLFAAMGSGGLLPLMFSQITLGVLLAIILAVHAVSMSEIFPTRTRQSGLSICYNVTAAVFAGTVPYVMTYFISVSGDSMVPAYYLMVVGVVGFATTLTLRETAGISLASAGE